MNLFGPREEDPLLQDDPFAPSSEQDPDESASEMSSAEADASPKNASQTTALPQEGGGAAQPLTEELPSEEIDSVFSRSGLSEVAEDPTDDRSEEGIGRVLDEVPAEEGHFAFEGEGDTRLLVRRAAEAAEGRLTVLNAALDQGWRLARVELWEGASEEGIPVEHASEKDRPEEEKSREEGPFFKFILFAPDAR